MRIRHLATIVCVALLSATPLSVRGQQDPLPPVTPKNGAPVPATEIILTSGPVAVYAPPTLGEAAAKNDYVSFAAFYNVLKTRGERVDAYTPLYDLWTWSLSDPIGAFYGRETYEQFARAYPSFAKYIAEYTIVDDAGNKYWPTSETRSFLLDRALAGDSTRIRVAEATPHREAPAVEIESTPAAPKVIPARTRAAKNRHRRAGVSPAPAKPKPVQVAQTKPQPAPAKPASAPAPAPTPAPQPVAAAAEPVATPTPVPAPITAAPVTETPVPAPVTEAPVTEAPIVPAPQTASTTKPWTNGIYMLLLLGVLGVGLFAILMRSPKEEDITLSKVIEKPPATVEPITKFTPAGGTRGNESPGSDEPRQHSPSSPDRSLRGGDVRGRRQ